MPQAPKKKTDGNRSTDSAYSAELRVVKEKLQCAHHSGPNRWCYVSPENPTEHVALGLEEITLWARKIVSSYVYITVNFFKNYWQA